MNTDDLLVGVLFVNFSNPIFSLTILCTLVALGGETLALIVSKFFIILPEISLYFLSKKVVPRRSKFYIKVEKALRVKAIIVTSILKPVGSLLRKKTREAI